mmetsp:Transcript_38579/g.44035  ORF Transcript_38579/g.44035 Transcript_38579/m.44035 type:complete len:467 (+) Transcript_38579:260-1660(+)
MKKRSSLSVLFFFFCITLITTTNKGIVFGEDGDDNDEDAEWGANLEPHPDPNDEDHEGMIYVGRHYYDSDNEKRRMGLENNDNGIKYIFGTSFDETHKDIEEELLQHTRVGPDSDHDLPQQRKTRDEVLLERRHNKVSDDGPKPFGHFEKHELDGGRIPPEVVHVEPYFLDANPVTNAEYGKFIRATYYETEAEKYGWSFVLASFLSSTEELNKAERDPEAEHWVTVDGAYWRRPEGPESTYKRREHHPVVHVSHRDAAEYCLWKGKRLPGEREWEAAARANHWGPHNRTVYSWPDGEQDKHANLWGAGSFPYENHAEDGWRGTSPVKTYLPNSLGFFDMTGNVWEWQRGGKHKERIVRGGSYVDSLDGSYNHAATLGARDTLHGTTTTGNVGFRCAKAPKRRVEHHYVYHDEEVHGQLSIKDQYGKRDAIPQRGWEDQFNKNNIVEDERVKRKVVKPHTRISTEL